jgi:hypothetical protein
MINGKAAMMELTAQTNSAAIINKCNCIADNF